MVAKNETYYLEREDLLEINRLVEHDSRIRDMALLESAIAAPGQAAYYEGADVIAQAALLIERIVLNHPFVDGNKRTSLIAGAVFLLTNNLQIVYVQDEEVLLYAKEIERLVINRDRERFLNWLSAHVKPFEYQAIHHTPGQTADGGVLGTALSARPAIELAIEQFAQELVYLKDR